MPGLLPALTVLAQPSHRRVLDVVRSERSVSRVELAHSTGLTPASITAIVRVLLEAGLIEEYGKVASAGGKPRTLLRLAPHALYGVGAHIGDAGVTYAMTDMTGRMIGRHRVEVLGETAPPDIVRRIGSDIETFIDELSIQRSDVLGVGVVSPGPASFISGEIKPVRGFPFATALSERLSMPVRVDSESNAAAIGQFWGASTQQPQTFLCAYLGVDAAIAIVHDGKVLRGASSNAGLTNRLWPRAAPRAVVRDALGSDVAGLEGSAVALAFDDVAKRALNGDRSAADLIVRSAESLAEAVLTAVELTDTELVVLAGPAFALPGAMYATVVRSRMSAAAGSAFHQIDVQLSTNLRDAAALGASAIVLQDVLSIEAMS
jgi:predicted NBD/HSP70 family sugar kinase